MTEEHPERRDDAACRAVRAGGVGVFTLIDLTQTLREDSLSYPGDVPAFTVERLDIGSPVATVSRFTRFDPHAGTHMDAPLHFAPDGPDLAALPLRVCPATVIGIEGGLIEADSIPADCADRAVLFSTGWERHAGTAAYYRGFPSITQKAARLLVERRVGLVGLDSPSVDGVDDHPAYPAHETLCGAGVPIVEGLVNLAAVRDADGEVWFAAFPLKIAGLEGSPVRAVAWIDRTDAGAPACPV